MNRIDTAIGALIAGGILFASNIVVLFTENPEMTLGAISQATWVSVAGGALVAGMKDYQAISARRLISSVRKSVPG